LLVLIGTPLEKNALNLIADTFSEMAEAKEQLKNANVVRK
jgi:hypothetical protein